MKKNKLISIAGKEVFEATQILKENSISFKIVDNRQLGLENNNTNSNFTTKKSSYPPSNSKIYDKNLYTIFIDDKFIVYKVEIGGYIEK